MKQPSDLLTVVQLAALRGESITTVKRKARAGIIPVAMKVPGRTGAYLFDMTAVAA